MRGQGRAWRTRPEAEPDQSRTRRGGGPVGEARGGPEPEAEGQKETGGGWGLGLGGERGI